MVYLERDDSENEGGVGTMTYWLAWIGCVAIVATVEYGVLYLVAWIQHEQYLKQRELEWKQRAKESIAKSREMMADLGIYDFGDYYYIQRAEWNKEAKCFIFTPEKHYRSELK